MSCVHIIGQSGPCSQCAGATPKVVTQEGAAMLVDGVHARPFMPARDQFARHRPRRKK